MTDFLDKLKALSEHSPSEQSARSTPQSNRFSLEKNMALDPQSKPSVPQEADSQPFSVELGQETNRSSVQDRPGGLLRFRHFLANRLRSKKPYDQRWWLWLLLAMGAMGIGTYVTARQSIAYIKQGLPETNAISTFVRDGTLTIKAADGTILQQMGPATRDKLAFDEIPDQLIDAFIAAEDKNFYRHEGVDYRAIARAVRANVSSRKIVEGASTITQQLARIVFLDQSPTLERKLREALLAQKIEAELTKDQILERYLNFVYLGSGAYGVADAAWIFFSKSVDELTLSEMAMIAGLAPAPSAYSPLVDLDVAKARRDLTLERMVEAEFISVQEMERVKAEPLEINPSLPRHFYSASPYFTSYIEDQLPNILTAEQIEQGGLTIETTLNLEWQRLAEETVQKTIDDYGQWQRFSQAAMVTIDPRDGKILTMVGGTDFQGSQFNRVTQAQRQPGSTFKAFVYSAAIAAGFSPYKTYVDAKFIVDGYEPQNYGRNFRGTVSIRDALVSSINVVAVKTLIDVGFTPVIDLAYAMGIKSNLDPYYSLALGASEVNLLELTSAYGTLAAQGNYIEPHGIVRILDRYDEVIYEADFEPQRALDADTSAIMTWMLQGVVDSGTGRRARLGRPVAGKTGTSEEVRDLWFIGYIPQLVTGVWLGNDDNNPTAGASSTAAQTWHNFMAQIVEEIPVETFPELPDLNNREKSIEADPVEPNEMRTIRPTPSRPSPSPASSQSSEESSGDRSNRSENEASQDVSEESEEGGVDASPDDASSGDASSDDVSSDDVSSDDVSDTEVSRDASEEAGESEAADVSAEDGAPPSNDSAPEPSSSSSDSPAPEIQPTTPSPEPKPLSPAPLGSGDASSGESGGESGGESEEGTAE